VAGARPRTASAALSVDPGEEINVMTGIYRAIGLAILLFASAALAADMPALRGDRFKPLTAAEMTPEQKALADAILAGPRASLNGPFNVMLRSPELGDRLQKVGEYVRFKTSIPPRLNELAILVTARAWTAQYEWYAHQALALKAGLPPAVIDDIAAGKRPSKLESDEAVVYDFTRELIDTKQVSDATFNAAKEKLGERGVVDLIGLIGYYHTVSMLLNVDRYPLPEGAKPPLAMLN
jgi:4-carboxymuconolactone decarboxylase